MRNQCICYHSGRKKYIDKLQHLQLRGIKIVYQYHIDGHQIKNTDEDRLHSELHLMPLIQRRRLHILHMIYDF